MGHVQHLDSEGVHIPSVSQIPGIFAKDMDGFEDWICRGLHTKEEKCCTKAKREFYQESANLGHDIHELREAFLRGESFEEGVPEYQATVFAPVAEFYKSTGYEALKLPDGKLAIETQMTGKEFGGSLDGAGTFGTAFWKEQRKTFWDKASREDEEFLEPTMRDIWIDDLKIKSKIDILHPLQLYGYSLLLREVYGVEANYGLIIRREKKLYKKPEIQLKGYYLPVYKKQWDAAMVCWKFLNQ